MREQKSWVDKSAKKKILPKMLFKIQKGDFSHRKMFVFFSYFVFCRSKEAKRMTGSNFPRPPFSSACKALSVTRHEIQF